MKNIYLLFASLLSTTAMMAQTVSPQVISTGGNFISSSAGSVSYTIGETVTPTLSGGGHFITQGFQQPTDVVNGLLDIEKEAAGSFSLYPIPATDKLWYGFEFPDQGKVTINLYTLLGQRLDYTLTEAYTSGKVIHSFDCSAFAAGEYILSANFTNGSASPKILSKQFVIIH